MPVSIEHLRQLVIAEDAKEWIDPKNVAGLDGLIIQKLNYDHGRLLASPTDLDYLEENGDRLIVAYIDTYLKNNISFADNNKLQSARLWLIQNYWSVAASYPVIGWLQGLKTDELEATIKEVIAAKANCNPFVEDLICSFARELLLSLSELELDGLLPSLSSESIDFIRYIKNEYSQDGYRFAGISFEEMKSRN